MLNYKLNAHGRSPPLLWLPPDTINSEQVIRYYREAQGGNGRAGTVPPSSYQCFVFHILAKRILQGHFQVCSHYSIIHRTDTRINTGIL
jgi:hypothetical protein